MESDGPRQRRTEEPEPSPGSAGRGSAGGDAVPAPPEVDRTDGGFLTLFKIALCMVIVPIAYIIALDQLVVDDIEPEKFHLPSRPRLEGALSPNDILTRSEKLFEGEVIGPESITVREGHLYTGTADGMILDIYNNQIRVVTRLGKPPCGGFKNEPNCGRPLGMRFNSEGELIVLDAYLGLFKVNVHTGAAEVLIDSKDAIGDSRPKFLNDLDISTDGMIYFTDSSNKWERRNWPLSSLENKPLGRLIQFNPKTSEVKVLKDGLYFANGVQISHDGSAILICESGRARIHRYYLSGRKQGESDIFIENLPGFPDNIRSSSSGGYWIGIASHRSAGAFSLVDALSNWPSIRRALAKALGPDVLLKILPQYGLILEVDAEGSIIRSFHDPKASVISAVSEVEDADGVLYLGSFKAPFIGKLDLRKL